MPSPLDTLESVDVSFRPDVARFSGSGKGLPLLPGVYARKVKYVFMRHGTPTAVVMLRGFRLGVFISGPPLEELTRSSGGEVLHHPKLGTSSTHDPQTWMSLPESAVANEIWAQLSEQKKAEAHWWENITSEIRHREKEKRRLAEARLREVLRLHGVDDEEPLYDVPSSLFLLLWGGSWRRRRSAPRLARELRRALLDAVRHHMLGTPLPGADNPRSIEARAWKAVTGESGLPKAQTRDDDRADMVLIVRCCDDFLAGKGAPASDAFYAAVSRQSKTLFRIAEYFLLPMADAPIGMLPPTTMRTCASWWLAD